MHLNQFNFLQLQPLLFNPELLFSILHLLNALLNFNLWFIFFRHSLDCGCLLLYFKVKSALARDHLIFHYWFANVDITLDPADLWINCLHRIRHRLVLLGSLKLIEILLLNFVWQHTVLPCLHILQLVYVKVHFCQLLFWSPEVKERLWLTRPHSLGRLFLGATVFFKHIHNVLVSLRGKRCIRLFCGII